MNGPFSTSSSGLPREMLVLGDFDFPKLISDVWIEFRDQPCRQAPIRINRANKIAGLIIKIARLALELINRNAHLADAVVDRFQALIARIDGLDQSILWIVTMGRGEGFRPAAR